MVEGPESTQETASNTNRSAQLLRALIDRAAREQAREIAAKEAGRIVANTVKILFPQAK
jgi:hypothetical protein